MLFQLFGPVFFSTHINGSSQLVGARLMAEAQNNASLCDLRTSRSGDHVVRVTPASLRKLKPPTSYPCSIYRYLFNFWIILIQITFHSVEQRCRLRTVLRWRRRYIETRTHRSRSSLIFG